MKERGIKLKRMVLASLFAMASVHAAIVPTSNSFTGRSSIDGWFSVGRVSTGVAYSNGAGLREDWNDNDTNAVQAAKGFADTTAVIAAGGIITGDGILADGALWFQGANDGIAQNEAIGFILGGTMETGEKITFSFNVFNRNRVRASRTIGQLWDLTDNRVLASSPSIWVDADSLPQYAPADGVVSYVVTAAENGHVLQVRFVENNRTTSSRDSYIDNFSIHTTR